MFSGSHIKLDLIEFIQVIDDINSKVGLQEGTPCVVPVTAGIVKMERLKQGGRAAEQLNYRFCCIF